MRTPLKLLIILGLLFLLHHSTVRSSQVDYYGLDDSAEGQEPKRTRTVTFQRTTNKYRGCYKDEGDRMFKRFYHFGLSSSIQHCINFCREEGYLYAGAQIHADCWCGNMFPKPPKYPKLSEDKCNKPCNGNPSQMCGGDLASSVYDTGNEIFVFRHDGTRVDMEDANFWRH